MIAAVALLTVASGRASAATRCGSHAAEVYARTSRAIVYGVQAGATDGVGRPIPTAMACLYGSRPIRLGDIRSGGSGGTSYLRLFRLAGSMLAYVNESADDSGKFSYDVVVVRLTDGKVLVDEPNGQIVPPPCCTASGISGYGSTSDLVVLPSGAIAWIAEESPLQPITPAAAVVTTYDGDVVYPYNENADVTVMLTCEWRVFALSGHGEQVLDTSTQIAPGTLRLTDDQLSWIDDHVRQTTSLD